MSVSSPSRGANGPEPSARVGALGLSPVPQDPGEGPWQGSPGADEANRDDVAVGRRTTWRRRRRRPWQKPRQTSRRRPPPGRPMKPPAPNRRPPPA
eukprot:121338-Prorocentrum_minimum.AAC.1